MKLSIKHKTSYMYSADVHFEPHYLRFKPRPNDFVSLEAFSLKVQPKPAGLSWQEDAESNIVCHAWFKEKCRHLQIESEVKLKLSKHNPFLFVVYPLRFLSYPFTYPQKLDTLLMAALESCHVSTELRHFGNDVMEHAKGSSLTFLSELTGAVHKNFKLITREVGEPYIARKTFEEKTGSCRDLAWMQIQLLRDMGFAAKFVSGYFFIEESATSDLHAWLEVFLPGAGWIGYDPSHGIAVLQTHIPVASSVLPEYTMPVTGSVRGSASSLLSAELRIEKI